MQRVRGPDGGTVAFSNGAMWTVYFACFSAAAECRPPETGEEDAVLAWRRSYRDDKDRYANAFALDLVEDEIAGPRRLAYLAELLRLLADDLAHGGAPAEDIRQNEVWWEPERQAHWLERLDALAHMVEAARFALVSTPRDTVSAAPTPYRT